MFKWRPKIVKPFFREKKAEPAPAMSDLAKKIIRAVLRQKTQVLFASDPAFVGTQYETRIGTFPESDLRVVVRMDIMRTYAFVEKKSDTSIGTLDHVDAMTLFEFFKSLHNVQKAEINKKSLENISEELDKILEVENEDRETN